MKKFVKKTLIIFCLVAFSQASLLSPAYSFSIGEERKIGLELLYTVRKVVKLVDDPDIHQYFKGLGDEVLNVAHASFFDYRFYIIKDQEFNAFAMPSGLIFFNTGLIEAAETEDELVFVLAHEVAHAVSRHIAAQIEKGTVVNISTLALALAALALGSGDASAALFVGSLAASKSFQLHFSRHDEEEADRLAYGWMKKMGRNLDAMVSMMRTMRRITRYRMGKTVPQYLLTHPNPEIRLDYIQAMLQQDKERVVKEQKTDDFAFTRMKYRILSSIKDSDKFRNYMAIKIADPQASPFDVIMAKYGLSQLDRIENNFENSLKLLGEVIKFFPNHPILQVDKGIIEYESGHIHRAVDLLEAARIKNPSDMYSTFTLARIYLGQQDLNRAQRYLSLVAAEMSEYPKVYFELGKLKSLQKKRGDSQYYLGKYNMFEGRLKLAKENFEKAKELKDTSEKFKKEAETMLELIEKVKE